MINVKNTIQRSLADLLAPHLCKSCGATGSILCDSCIYDIIENPFTYCIVCRRPTNSKALCGSCSEPYERAWCVGEHVDAIKSLVAELKFDRAASVARQLAALLDQAIDDLPTGTVVTSIPTHSAHIRRRGYDHARLIAREFAQRRGLRYRDLLKRQTQVEQRGANRANRMAQAKRAFTARFDDVHDTVLLIDDVFTTGATVRNGAAVLRKAGAERVWVAVVARQPLPRK